MPPYNLICFDIRFNKVTSHSFKQNKKIQVQPVSLSIGKPLHSRNKPGESPLDCLQKELFFLGKGTKNMCS